MFNVDSRPITGSRRAPTLRPRLEGLEARLASANFKVNTFLDTVAVNIENGKDPSGHVSLRSAIMAANARPNADNIKLQGGIFKQSLAGAGEDQDSTGDLDISSKLTIKGSAA
jgi:hypothetical protein